MQSHVPPAHRRLAHIRFALLLGACLQIASPALDGQAAGNDGESPDAESGAAGFRAEELTLGLIYFPTSGEGAAEREFLTGVLAMHSFWYREARTRFRRARRLDPDYAMAYWGEALTYDHPQWREQDRRAGARALRALDANAASDGPHLSERERAYIDAARVLFDGGVFLRNRRRAYAAAMTELAERYPEDREAAAFSALARMSVAGFDKSDPSDVEPVAAVLERLYRENPEHPGAMHYLIHLYDSPRFAERGLGVAGEYAAIARSASHAVHMPSHIYKQLGMYEEMEQANMDAYQVSVAWQQRTGRAVMVRDFHAYQWLFDARIALGKYDQAREQLASLEQMCATARGRDEATGDMPWLVRYFRRTLRRSLRR